MPECSHTTAKGKPCRKRPLPGIEPPTCRYHLGPMPRADSLTDELADRLVGFIVAGNHVHTAVVAAGISQATFYAWLDRGDPARNDPRDEAFREFRARVEHAREEGVARNVTLVAQAGAHDWRAAAWMLERTAPGQFARSALRERTGGDPDAAQTGATDDDPFAQLQGDPIGDELAERRARRGGPAAADA